MIGSDSCRVHLSCIRHLLDAYTAAVTVTFDPLVWALTRGCVAGPSVLEPPTPPALEGTITVDELSLAVVVDPALPAVAVERHLRERGLTLGCFPDRYEVDAIRDLVARDDPGAGASGPGFASLVLEADARTLTLAVRRRPAAQAGRGLLLESLAAGAEVLRRLAQDGLVPDIALLTDAVGADLLLAVAGDPDGALARVGGAALAILIASGGGGEAALRLEEAMAAFSDCTVADLGQNAARAWAGTRYDLVRHVAVLAGSGIRLRSTSSWHRWSELPAGLPARPAGVDAGRDLLGAGPHGARLVSRSLTCPVSAEREHGDAGGDEDRAQQPQAGHVLVEEHGGEAGGDHHA